MVVEWSLADGEGGVTPWTALESHHHNNQAAVQVGPGLPPDSVHTVRVRGTIRGHVGGVGSVPDPNAGSGFDQIVDGGVELRVDDSVAVIR